MNLKGGRGRSSKRISPLVTHLCGLSQRIIVFLFAFPYEYGSLFLSFLIQLVRLAAASTPMRSTQATTMANDTTPKMTWVLIPL